MTKARGDMYSWVTHCHTHLGGKCPHGCSYCWVQKLPKSVREGKYSGPLRLYEKDLIAKLGKGKTIFIGHCTDMWAEQVPTEFISRILAHCREYPGNNYCFQSKNPGRFLDCWDELPAGSILGTTIESDIHMPEIMVKAPSPEVRMRSMCAVTALAINGGTRKFKTFVTIEPILACNPDVLAHWMNLIKPDWVNIGADSCGHGLPEPTSQEVLRLTDLLGTYGIELREKNNLARLKK